MPRNPLGWSTNQITALNLVHSRDLKTQCSVYLMADFHEIQMTTIHIQLPKLLSRQENTFPILSNAANLALFALLGMFGQGVLGHVELAFSLETPLL